jgi:hypothetical protein
VSPAHQATAAGRTGRPAYARRAGAAALVLAALAAGRAVTSAFPADDSISSPFLRSGTLGQPVSLRYADLTATAVQGSTCVASGVGGTAGMRTPGVFVVVPVVIVTKGEPATVGYAALQDRRGRTFLASGSRSSFRPGPGQPGVPRYANVVIEVPPDAVAGSRLRIALDGLDQRRDDMADIDLGLTGADAAEWTRSRSAISIPEASDLPPAAAPAGGPCEGRP